MIFDTRARPDIGELMLALDRVYGHHLVRTGVDFVRISDNVGSLPYVGLEEDGSPYVELESLDWHTRKRVSLKMPSELAVLAGPKNLGPRQIGERIEQAVRELREPPPLWVE